MGHVRRGDNVIVTKGREQGKRGKIKRVLTSGRVEIEKIMMVKRHMKPTQKNPQGGIIDIEGTVAIANVALWCETCNAGRRSKSVLDDKGRKGRACVKCDAAFVTPGM